MKKIILILIKFLSCVILIPIIILCLLVGIFFLLNNTGHINKIALSFMNHHIDGEMYFDSLRFDFKEFPVIDVKAKNGLLLSGISIPKGDTLCYFDV